MQDNKCANCGGTLQFNEDKTESKCPYCGSSFKSVEKKEEIKYKNIKDLQIDESEEEPSKHKFSMFIFILLLIFGTPAAAVVYLIFCIIRNK